MTSEPYISILIAVSKDNENLRECIEKCLLLEYSNFDIVVLADEYINLPYDSNRVKIFPTGRLNPGMKRDFVKGHINCNVFAFLNDDAYPKEDWLKNAIRHLNSDKIGAVCGPAITPSESTLLQKASGLVYSSFLISGPHRRRYIPTKKCFVDDYPSCNFFVKKEVFWAVGGFDTQYWPGEDTILCLKITKKLKKKILYSPDIVVFHKRRPLFGPHLRQIKSYALHRGYFIKRFPQNSLKITYFLPTFLLIFLTLGPIVMNLSNSVKFFYLIIIAIYLLTAIWFSAKQDGYKLKVMVFLGILSTHLTYGLYFLKGIFSNTLKEEYPSIE